MKFQKLQFKKKKSEKISNPYLMKIQICFVVEKKKRFVFKENTYQFCDQKKFKSLFNENTNQFCDKKNTKLYLMKI